MTMEKPFYYSQLKKETYQFPDDGTIWNYLPFESLEEYQAFVQEESTRLSTKNKAVWEQLDLMRQEDIKQRTGYLGDFSGSLEQLKGHNDFQRKDLMHEVETEVKKHLQDFLHHAGDDMVEHKSLAFNAHGFGVFSFDRAAIGLFKLYIHPVTGQSVPQEYRRVGLITQPDGTFRRVHHDWRDGFENPPELREVFRTSVRDVYAHYEVSPKPIKAYSIWIKAGAPNTVEGRNMLYTGMGVCVLADYLTNMGYSVEINVIVTSIHPKTKVGYMSLIKAKRYNDYVDKNLIAVLTSDPAWYRYQAFRGMTAAFNVFNETINLGFGNIASDKAIRTFVRGITQTSTIKPIIFPSAYSLQEIFKQVLACLKEVRRDENQSKIVA